MMETYSSSLISTYSSLISKCVAYSITLVLVTAFLVLGYSNSFADINVGDILVVDDSSGTNPQG